MVHLLSIMRFSLIRQGIIADKEDQNEKFSRRGS